MNNRYETRGALRDNSGRVAVRDTKAGQAYYVNPDGSVVAADTGKPLSPGGRIASAVRKAARKQ